MNLLCPICAEQLNLTDRQYRCPRNHSFDIARQGHVNLLPVQQKRSLSPGDTAQQVAHSHHCEQAQHHKGNTGGCGEGTVLVCGSLGRTFCLPERSLF